FPTPIPAGSKLYKIDTGNNYTVIPATQYTRANGTTLDINLTDGGAFDLDGVANGIIIDPVTVGGVAPVVAQPGGGGCSINPTTGFDPSLILMTLFSLLYLLRRKRHIGKV
ncbi:MAG: choice-of-anchor U domain-containing protein, partial [Mariprofundus sp.]